MRSRLFALLIGGFVVACAPTPREVAPGPGLSAPEAKAPPAGVVPGTDKDAWYVDPWSLGYERPRSRGGTFTYAFNSKPQTLNPWGLKLFAEVFLNNAYDSLLARRLLPGSAAIESDVICRLCESWEMKADQKTWVFKLRQKVKFHNGTEFTGEDVKFSYEKAMDPKTASEFRTLLTTTIADIRVRDPYTVEIVTREPAGDLPQKLGFGGFVMVSKAAFEGGVDYNKAIVGTGPFKIERFDETEYVAVRNPDFWLPERPYLDKLIGKFVGDKSTRAAGFIAKQLDIHTTFDLREMEPVQKVVPTGRAERYPGPDQALLVNIHKKPLDDVRVRKAMHLAIDREEIARQLTSGLARPHLGVGLPPGWLAKAFSQEEIARLPGFQKPKDQEIAEAKRLLTEAGYPNGFSVRSSASAASTSNVPFNEAAAGQLKKVGIDVTLEHVEAAVAYKNETECIGELFTTTGSNSSSILSGQLLNLFATGGSKNSCSYSNPEYDRLYVEFSRTVDEKERWTVVKKMQQILFEDLPLIPLGEVAHHAIWHPWVHNWRNYGHSWAFPWATVVEVIWLDAR